LDYARSNTLTGETFVVTGATSGIGREVSRQLAARGASLVLVARDEVRAGVEKAVLARLGQGQIEIILGDLSRQRDVRRIAAEILERAPRITALINDAGVSPFTRRMSEDGIELGIAVNVLAPFLLTQLLRARLVQSGARIVNVAGAYHKKARLDLEDLAFTRGFDPLAAGNQAKLMLVMLTLETARDLSGTRATCNCLHPGIARTGIQRELPWTYQLMMRTLLRPIFGAPRGPAANVVHLATAAELARVTGRYFHGRRLAAPSPLAENADLVRRVWVWCEEATRSPPLQP
jgi:retinol dehydrogenase-14